MLTKEQLVEIMPRCSKSKVDVYSKYLAEAMSEGQINTVTRAAAFLGQLSLESGELRYMEEIADGSAYEGRKDLGNINPGDGKRYKGRGPIQLTGRANYRLAGNALGVDLENYPEKAADPTIAFRVAVWYWKNRKLNERADALDYKGITKAINGGYTHHDRRVTYYNKALEVLGKKALI